MCLRANLQQGGQWRQLVVERASVVSLEGKRSCGREARAARDHSEGPLGEFFRHPRPVDLIGEEERLWEECKRVDDLKSASSVGTCGVPLHEEVRFVKTEAKL